MFPIGWLLVFLTWGLIMLMFRPEKPNIPGLRDKAQRLYREAGPLTREEIFVGLVVLGVIVTLSLKSFIPAMSDVDKTAVVLLSTIIFFIFRILSLEDLEQIPWNIVLLFAGAMSIGFCLWETGAAKWMAVNWLVMFQESNWFVFVMGIAFFIMMMTNFIMNVAAIAISLPVALVIAPYLGVAAEVVLFAALAVAACPYLLLVGAAPNAIAYDSGQFTAAQFFKSGIPASLVLMAVVAFAVGIVWPLMGMPVTI
jgi:sodium-dependent dicarboxylate transporter 2/3/5